jgi:hypothetical protein
MKNDQLADLKDELAKHNRAISRMETARQLMVSEIDMDLAEITVPEAQLCKFRKKVQIAEIKKNENERNLESEIALRDDVQYRLSLIE